MAAGCDRRGGSQLPPERIDHRGMGPTAAERKEVLGHRLASRPLQDDQPSGREVLGHGDSGHHSVSKPGEEGVLNRPLAELDGRSTPILLPEHPLRDALGAGTGAAGQVAVLFKLPGRCLGGRQWMVRGHDQEELIALQ